MRGEVEASAIPIIAVAISPDESWSRGRHPRFGGGDRPRARKLEHTLVGPGLPCGRWHFLPTAAPY